MSDSPTITVVIPTHNRNDLLQRTLESLSQVELPESYHQTIVIENGGRFGAEQVASQAESRLQVHYEYFEQGNKSAALNHVLSIVEDDLLVFFDDDIRVAEGLLQSYACVARDWPDCFFGGPMDCDYPQEPEPWIDLPPSALGWRPSTDKDLIFLGCNWAAFAKHLRECGGFDPRVGPGGTTGARGQETSMQHKLRAHGYSPRYISEALVWHYVPANRCDEKWALNRAFENGLTFGLSIEEDGQKLFGVPRWRLRRLGLVLLRALYYSATRGKPEAHSWWSKFHFQRGQVVGLRITSRAEKSSLKGAD